MANLDRVLGGLAIAIFLAGMFMLVGGVGSLGDEGEGNKSSRKSGDKSK